MSRHYAVLLEDLAQARVAYERDEPRDLFYRVALAIIADAEAGRGQFSVVEGLAVLLQSWNLGYYRRARHPFDQAHYEAITELLAANRAELMELGDRAIETMTDADRSTVERLFDRFVAVLGPVGSAKTLHLLAPRWFPIFDNYILQAFRVWGRDGHAYWRFTTAIKAQVEMVGGEAAAGPNVVKALDELSFCRFTLRLTEFADPVWIDLPGTKMIATLVAIAIGLGIAICGAVIVWGGIEKTLAGANTDAEHRDAHRSGRGESGAQRSVESGAQTIVSAPRRRRPASVRPQDVVVQWFASPTSCGIGWRGRIRTFNPLIQSQVPYR
jgi:hypothetical protein